MALPAMIGILIAWWFIHHKHYALGIVMGTTIAVCPFLVSLLYLVWSVRQSRGDTMGLSLLFGVLVSGILLEGLIVSVSSWFFAEWYKSNENLKRGS